MKRISSQKGFADLSILVIVAVVLVVAGVGSLVYMRKPKATNVAKQTTATPANDAQTTSPGGIPAGANNTSTAPTPAASGHTVAIAAAGFQITVPDTMKDLTYHANGTTVSFSTTRLANAAASCAANAGTGAFVTITRGTGTYQAPANPADGGLIKQYSGYYLSYMLRQGPCAKGLSTDTQSLLDEQSQAFYGSLQTVKPL